MDETTCADKTISNEWVRIMTTKLSDEVSMLQENTARLETLNDLAQLANYSLMDSLNRDPDATENGVDHHPRQVFSGHYVPVLPTPIENPEYVAHSKSFFRELGFADSLASSENFVRMFSGDISDVPFPMRKVGWACGYALSIFGTEYIQQCPFQTGNGYGDGRAVSVLEAVINNKRWEMQLKGGGRTPYCRGGDGRAVLRSSVREFLAQEHMQALGVPTSRSLSLYVSKTERVQRPWYSEGSCSRDPDRMISEPVAISTRVAPSFLRVGQLELFARRARNNVHPKAKEELEMIVLHLIDREYSGQSDYAWHGKPSNNIDDIDHTLSIPEKVVLLARAFRDRLTSLMANWIRVGYCQGNFNSDNCAAGGFTLDYGPFGFCDEFNPQFQPWTGGGFHFSFMNQTEAAERNFHMFWTALRTLLETESSKFTECVESKERLAELDEIRSSFAKIMQEKMEAMWAAKLGLSAFDADLFRELELLMVETPVDYTIFFRELSSIPDDIAPLKKSFYKSSNYESDQRAIDKRWAEWLTKWTSLIDCKDVISKQMKLVNPKYCLREWFVVPAYQQAAVGEYSLVRELQEVMTQPYAEQSKEIEDKYYRLKPAEFFEAGGLSHYSCSS